MSAHLHTKITVLNIGAGLGNTTANFILGRTASIPQPIQITVFLITYRTNKSPFKLSLTIFRDHYKRPKNFGEIFQSN